jgi:hypothetical protein
MGRKISLVASLALAVAASALLAPAASAAVPAGLTQQGRLFDKAGKPATGAIDVVFTLYDAATAGTSLWTEKQSITLDDGYFSARLGDVTPIPTTVWDGTVRFLGVQVGTDAEMTPRESLNSVPYAIVAGDVNGDIHPTSVSIGATKVIDGTGKWVGPALPASPTTVRDSDGSSGSTPIPGSYGFAYVCKTPSYVATAGDHAMIWSHGSCQVPVGNGFGIRVGYNTGGADANLGSWHYHTSTGSGSPNIDNAQFAYQTLTAGTTYIWSTAIVNSDTGAAYTATNCYCHTMVQILK